MKSDGRAIMILLSLVGIAVIIFLAEKKFLIVEARGETLSKYEKLPWHDKIILLVEDFEGLTPVASHDSVLNKAFLFGFGSAKLSIDNRQVDKATVASRNDLKVQWSSANNYGGWGRGVGANIDLDISQDYFTFRIFSPTANVNNTSLKIIVQDEDNYDGKFDENNDDVWVAHITIPAINKWQMVSVPLSKFIDDNKGGDGIFNVTRKGGIHNIAFSFEQTEKYTANSKWYFDFICFTNAVISNKDIETN
jgi:hypothetical protein